MLAGKMLFAVLFGVAIAILTGCHPAGYYTYRAPNSAELDQFIAQNAIQPLAVATRDDFAVILFENGMKTGHYLLYVGEDGRLYKEFAITTGPHLEDVLVSSSGQHPTWTTTPFVTVIFMDDQVLNEAAQIVAYFGKPRLEEVILSPGTERGYIIMGETDADNPDHTVSLLIYDAAGSVLYEYNSDES
ncbi:MAG: hypothetical protein AB1767_00225 [Bacillota bacterium]